MKIDYKHLWGEVTVIAGCAFYFLMPSLQVYAANHPGTATAGLLTAIIGMGLKPSPISKGVDQ